MRTAFTLLLLLTSALSADPPNSCADPYWKDTLRCVVFPNEVPQPNLHEIPRVADGQPVPKFTRIFLEDDAIRCIDGTRPLIYVDKAICTIAGGCGAGVERGEAIESNRWIFSAGGGDSCNGPRCGFFYVQPGDRGSMGSSGKRPMVDEDGINSPDPVANPVFAGYNRVRIEKCTFDRHLGRAAEAAPGGAITSTLPDGTTISYNAFHHGFLIYDQAFRTLEKGLHYTSYRRKNANEAAGRRRSCCGPGAGNQLTPFEERLPPLADAETVLLIGHSNASHGQYHNADNLAAALRALPGFDGDVRALFDENFLPSVENEAAFATSAPPNRDVYHGIWSGTSSGRGETFTYDGDRYHATNRADAEYAAHGVVHDQSCLEAHAPSGTTWMCRERLHVLFNHITTPFMVRQDVSDPNVDHLDMPHGYSVRWGDSGNFSYCPDGPPCEPRFSPLEFRARVEKQAQTLLASAWTRSELARGEDNSPDPSPTMFVWMPDCAQHEGAYGNNPFYDTTITTSATSFTMRTWLEEFMAAPRTGVRRFQIDDASDPSGRKMNTTRCE